MEAWENFLAQEEAEFGSETIEKWLRSLKIVKFDACNIYLEAKDGFQALWFEEHIRAKVLLKLFNNNKRQIKVHLSIAGAPKEQKNRPIKNKIASPPIQPSLVLTFDSLDPYCSFEHFVPGPTNQLAIKVLLDLCNEPSQLRDRCPLQYNPIYLYGGPGTGKTHLLMATAESLKSQGLNVIYTRAETFTEHVISAIRAGEMSTFRQAYRNVDVLLIDNVQIFSRKAATQEELFHTFNSLHISGKQIILASNTAPQGLLAIEPRLTSRFEWGITIPLESQSREEQVLILSQRAEALNYRLSTKLSTFLIDTFKTGTHSQIQALQALILRTHLHENERAPPITSLSIPQAQAILHDLLTKEQSAILTPEKIVLHVAEQFGILTEDILKKKQSRDCVLPRQISMYFCRMELKMPFTKIGHFFSKDHSTVISSIRIIERGIVNNDNTITDPLFQIKKNLKVQNAK